MTKVICIHWEIHSFTRQVQANDVRISSYSGFLLHSFIIKKQQTCQCLCTTFNFCSKYKYLCSQQWPLSRQRGPLLRHGPLLWCGVKQWLSRDDSIAGFVEFWVRNFKINGNSNNALPISFGFTIYFVWVNLLNSSSRDLRETSENPRKSGKLLTFLFPLRCASISGMLRVFSGDCLFLFFSQFSFLLFSEMAFFSFSFFSSLVLFSFPFFYCLLSVCLFRSASTDQQYYFFLFGCFYCAQCHCHGF